MALPGRDQCTGREQRALLGGGAFIDKIIPAGLGGIDGPRVIEWKAKITICHRPSDNPANDRTISIAYMSGFDHVAHADALGACPT